MKRFRSDSVLACNTFGPGCKIHLSRNLNIGLQKYMYNTTYLSIHPSVYISVITSHVRNTTSKQLSWDVSYISQGTRLYPVGHNWSTPCSVANPWCPNMLPSMEARSPTLTFWGGKPPKKKHVGQLHFPKL